jgi:hypothetical protein
MLVSFVSWFKFQIDLLVWSDLVHINLLNLRIREGRERRKDNYSLLALKAYPQRFPNTMCAEL